MAKRVEDDFLKEVEIGCGRNRAEICFFFFFNDLLRFWPHTCLSKSESILGKHVGLCFSAWWAARHWHCTGNNFWFLIWHDYLCRWGCLWAVRSGEDILLFKKQTHMAAVCPWCRYFWQHHRGTLLTMLMQAAQEILPSKLHLLTGLPHSLPPGRAKQNAGFVWWRVCVWSRWSAAARRNS